MAPLIPKIKERVGRFLETIRKLDKAKHYILIFGHFWSQKNLDDIGIEYKCLGFIDDEKIMNAAYSCSDVFVFPSIQEAFGKTWVEAIACNTPVVCFDKTPASEILQHKKNSYIVKNISSEELKIGIDWILCESERGTFLKTLKNEKIDNFDQINIAKKYIKLYENLLNRN